MATSALLNQKNVIYALFMRDMQTRFAGGGGGYFNYLITLGWPLAHIAMLLIIYGILGRASPMGQDATMFFATGLVPFMIYQYPARFMMMSIMMNKPLTAIPIIKTLDIMLARALLEIITGFFVVCVTAAVLYGLGHHIMPRDPGTAVTALAASLFLALGLGLFNAVMVQIVKPWLFIYILITIVLYISSGILFVISAMPVKLQNIMWWNPTSHIVAWFRMSYYDGYATAIIPDKTYVLMFSLGCLLFALMAERFILPKLAP